MGIQQDLFAKSVEWTSWEVETLRDGLATRRYEFAAVLGSESPLRSDYTYLARRQAIEDINRDRTRFALQGLAAQSGAKLKYVVRWSEHAAWLRTPEGRNVYPNNEADAVRFGKLADEAQSDVDRYRTLGRKVLEHGLPPVLAAKDPVPPDLKRCGGCNELCGESLVEQQYVCPFCMHVEGEPGAEVSGYLAAVEALRSAGFVLA